MTHGPRARFNEFLSQIITSQDVDGSELLIIIGMLRERTLREEFLECLHNHAPCFRLSQISYYNLLDIIRALLREANNSGDFKSIAAIFSTSRLYGRSVGSFVFSILKSLPTHEAWSNVAFWMQCTDEIVADDIQRWKDLPSKSKKILNIPESQVYSFLAINRIQAVAFGSMQAVGVSSGVVRRYIDTACEYHGLQPARIDVTLPPSQGFVLWLLDVAIEQKQRGSIEMDRHGVDYMSEDSDIDTRSKRVSLGFSSLQELMFLVAMRMSRDTSTSFAATDLCVCGLPLGGWQPLGLFDERTSQREHIPTVLCEGCFRHATSSLATLSSVVGDIGRCVVPDVNAARPKSFLGIYYGKKAERNEFRGTTGENVKLYLLDSQASAGSVTKKNSFIRNEQFEKHSSAREISALHDGGRKEPKNRSSSDMLSSEHLAFPHTSTPDYDEYGGKKGSGAKTDRKNDQMDADVTVRRAGLRKFLSLMRSGVDVVKVSNTPITRHTTKTFFLDKEAQRLCWLPPGRAALIPEIRHSIPIDSIRSIKIGSGKFEQCISIVSDQKTILIKVEDSKMFANLVEGFLLITENNRNSES